MKFKGAYPLGSMELLSKLHVDMPVELRRHFDIESDIFAKR